MIREALTDTVSFFRNHLAALAALIIPFAILHEVVVMGLSGLAEKSPNPEVFGVVVSIATFCIMPLVAAASVFLISSIARGEPIRISECWRLGLKFWWPALKVHFLVVAIVTVGLFLLIVPGVIAGALLAFSVFEVLLNGERTVDALKKSYVSAKPFLGTLILGILNITIILYLPRFLVVSLMEEGSTPYVTFYYVANVVYWLLEVIFTIFFYRVYEMSRDRVE